MLASDRAYARLRQDIISGRLAPGTALGEVEQAGRLGVSRTPLREALRRLGAEGLCVVGKGRTYTVAAIEPDDVRHLFELREALECQAARLAAMRGEREVFTELARRFGEAAELLLPQDPEHARYYDLVADLDAALDEAMASPAIQRALVSLRSQVARARRLSRDDHARLAAAAQEHQIIAQAIADGDGTLAAQATAIHLRASLDNILTALSDSSARPDTRSRSDSPPPSESPATDARPISPTPAIPVAALRADTQIDTPA